MKFQILCQSLFSRKSKKNISLSPEFARSMISVKSILLKSGYQTEMCCINASESIVILQFLTQY